MYLIKLFFTSLLCSILLLSDACAQSDRPLIFGTIPIARHAKLMQMYKGLLDYYRKELGREVRFEMGKDYDDAIRKFQSGHFDFGFLGPSPYIVATETSPLGIDNFRLAATIETLGKPYYRAVIVAHKDNDQINTIEDIKKKSFAFGSRRSTLSFYLPAKMLIDSGVFHSLKNYRFVGKHDIVINAVHQGIYFDAGGVKEDMAERMQDLIKIVDRSIPVWDFLIVTHHNISDTLFQAIKQATLKLKDREILGNIKKGATGFVPTMDRYYEPLREIMHEVDSIVPISN